jgi:very-short-patch-repair endonuclease
MGWFRGGSCATSASGAVRSRHLRRGSLIPLHRGVYAIGHRQLRQEGRWLAAVLAAGPGAVLSHRDAAALHEMRKGPEGRPISVSTAAHVRAIHGVWVKARRTLAYEDRAIVRGIPVTSAARTIVDLAPMLTPAQLATTLGEADRRAQLDVAAVERALRRIKGRHGQGHRRLNAALNAPAAGFEVDALWRRERVVVELDGWLHHSGRAAAAVDRDKTNKLQVAGYVVLRFMHGDLVCRPEQVAAAVRDALTACGT